MKINSVEKTHNSVKFVIHVEAADIEAELQKEYLAKRKDYNVHGFRSGKAPRKMIEAAYGRNVFLPGVIDRTFMTYLRMAAEERGVRGVFAGVTLVDTVDGYTFEGEIAVRAESTIEGYKGLKAYRPDDSVTEQDVDNRMEQYIRRATNLVCVEREAQMGDTVVLDYSGSVDGVAFEGGTEENRSLKLGDHRFIPGFEEQIVGLKAGYEGDINATFPENYPEKKLAGQAAVFHVVIREVQEEVVPELNDEFAKDVSEYDTLEEFRDSLRRELQEERSQYADSIFSNGLAAQLADMVQVDIHSAVVDERENYLGEQCVQQYGEQFRNLLKDESVKQSLRAQAIQELRVEAAQYAVAEAEGLEVSQEEIEAEYEKEAGLLERTVEELKGQISEEDVRDFLLRQKAMKLVMENAVAESLPENAGPAPDAEAQEDAGEPAPAADAPAADSAE